MASWVELVAQATERASEALWMVVVVRERRWTLGDALRSDQQTASAHAPSQRRVLSTCPRRRVQIWMTRSRIGSSAVRTLPRTIRSSGKRPGGVEPVGSVGRSPDFGSFASSSHPPRPRPPPPPRATAVGTSSLHRHTYVADHTQHERDTTKDFIPECGAYERVHPTVQRTRDVRRKYYPRHP